MDFEKHFVLRTVVVLWDPWFVKHMWFSETVWFRTSWFHKIHGFYDLHLGLVVPPVSIVNLIVSRIHVFMIFLQGWFHHLFGLTKFMVLRPFFRAGFPTCLFSLNSWFHNFFKDGCATCVVSRTPWPRIYIYIYISYPYIHWPLSIICINKKYYGIYM